MKCPKCGNKMIHGEDDLRRPIFNCINCGKEVNIDGTEIKPLYYLPQAGDKRYAIRGPKRKTGRRG